jgi:glycogen debranching enzyme
MSYLEGMRAHLSEACSGQISEIFDGDAPFTSRGCFAQAWGVAELLRAGSYIHEVDQSGATSIEHAKKKSRSGNER